MSLVIRKHSHTRASTAQITRGIAKLSNGKFAVLTYNSNITAKSGSSSEKNKIAKLYVTVFNADWTTQVVASIAVSGANTKHVTGQIATLAVDSSDNIHVVYNYRTAPNNSALLSQGQTLRYRKVTYNGTSLVVGGETTIFSTAGYYTGLDMDVPLGVAVANNPVVGFVHTVNGTSMQTRIMQLSGLQVTQIQSVNSAARGVSIALNNVSDDASYKWLATIYQEEAGADAGDTIIYGSGTTSSAPLVTNTLASELNVGQGNGVRLLTVFKTGNVFIIAGPVSVNTLSYFIAAYRIPNTGGPSILYSPGAIAVNAVYEAVAGYRQFAASQIDTVNSNVITHLTYKKNVYAQVLNYLIAGDESSISFALQTSPWKMDTQYLGKNIVPSQLFNGDRAFAGPVDIKVIVNVPEAYLYVLYRRVPISGIIKSVLATPANNGTVTTSSPKITATVTGNANNNIVGRLQVQVAKDSAFSSGVQDFYGAYQTFLKAISVDVQVPASALDQTLYYSRMRVVDNTGYAYGWSDLQQFNVSHKPVASIVKPSRGEVAVFNPDNSISITLGFKDSDSNDQMAARQVILTQLDGTVITDTGKVASSAASFNVTIPSGAVDQDVIMTAYVWDSYDIRSDAVTLDFYLAAVPDVTIDGPTAGETVTTAQPMISWEPILPGTRTQASYRVIYRKQDGSLVWDSKVIKDDAVAYVTPLGKLKNDTAYLVTVTITDSLGMTVSDSVTFYTGWARPVACPAPFVDLTLYDSLGFAYVTIVPPTVAPEAIPYAQLVLMRRSIFSNDDWQAVATLQMGSGLNYSALDSTLPSGVDSFYAVVLQIDTDGDLAIGDPDFSIPTKITTPASNYWLVSQNDAGKNFRLAGVTADSYTDEFEQETYNIVNRGRWQDVGEHLGYSGNLTVRIIDREAGLGGYGISNFLSNPRLLSTGVGIAGLAKWTLSTSAYVDVVTKSPCPIGKGSSIAIHKTSGAAAKVSQIVPIEAGNFTLSFWVETSLVNSGAGKSITVTTVFKDDSNATLGTFSRSFDLVLNGTAMVPVGAGLTVTPSIIGRAFDWYRADLSALAPSGSKSVEASISFTTGSTGDYLAIGAAMLIDSLDSSVKFFDGNTLGAEWFGEEHLSRSFSAGKVTARLARRRLLAIASSKTDQYYLRNPFGDVFAVSPGNIQIERMAGTGQDEFVTATIPYVELGLND